MDLQGNLKTLPTDPLTHRDNCQEMLSHLKRKSIFINHVQKYLSRVLRNCVLSSFSSSQNRQAVHYLVRGLYLFNLKFGNIVFDCQLSSHLFSLYLYLHLHLDLDLLSTISPFLTVFVFAFAFICICICVCFAFAFAFVFECQLSQLF